MASLWLNNDDMESLWTIIIFLIGLVSSCLWDDAAYVLQEIATIVRQNYIMAPVRLGKTYLWL